MENRKIKKLKNSDDYLRADIEISSGMLMNQEYSLQITLDTDNGDAYYYTRLVSRSSTNTAQYVQFVSDFAQMCMDKNSADNLADYLESAESSTRNFADISIKFTTFRYQLGKSESADFQKRNSSDQRYQ